jgi:hypothetical protein
MSGTFRCSIYARLFHDREEQQRLFQIGLKAGRDYVEGPNPDGAAPCDCIPYEGQESKIELGLHHLCN